jgi:HSP20 family protein
MSGLIRYDWPESTVMPLFEEDLSDMVFDRCGRCFTDTMWPRVDIVERPDSFLLTADLPGLGKEDVKIVVEDGTLTISGRKGDLKKEHKKGNYCHYERSYGDFSRSFGLPTNVDESKVTAHFRNGLLELTLTKKPESVTKAIEIPID